VDVEIRVGGEIPVGIKVRVDVEVWDGCEVQAGDKVPTGIGSRFTFFKFLFL
jgi:hypothetical protein